MKIFIGLGNPGHEYEKNRHNVGFMFVDFLSKKYDGSEWKMNKYTQSEESLGAINGEKILLAKPQTFMNLSGSAVKKLVTSYELQVTNLVIVHDDLDIPLGKYRIDMARGPKLHNGIESIEHALGTKDFIRVRIGVDNRQGQKIPGEAYVLQNFTTDEQNDLQNVFSQVQTKLEL